MDIYTIGCRGTDITAPCSNLENAKELIFNTWRPDNPNEVKWREGNNGTLWTAEYLFTALSTPLPIDVFIVKWDGFQGE